MSQLKSKRLKIVRELAERKKNRAAEQVQEAQLRLKDGKNRLQGLEDYYSEYENNFNARGKSLRANEIQNQRVFLGKLTEATKQQEEQIQLLEKDLQNKLQIWRTCHLKQQSLDELIQRLKKEENLQLDKKEQAILDELHTNARNRQS